MKTAVDNPMVNPSRSRGRRTALLLYEGELEGNFGCWADDETNGAEGFLDTVDVFGSGTTMTTHGSREAFKEEEPGKEKEKEEEPGKEKETTLKIL